MRRLFSFEVHLLAATLAGRLAISLLCPTALQVLFRVISESLKVEPIELDQLFHQIPWQLANQPHCALTGAFTVGLVTVFSQWISPESQSPQNVSRVLLGGVKFADEVVSDVAGVALVPLGADVDVQVLAGTEDMLEK